MIIKGRTRKDGAALGHYLLREDRNEQVDVWEGLEVAGGMTLPNFLQSFELCAVFTRCAKPLYHLQMRTDDGEHLTRQQWLYAVEKTEQQLELVGHERVIVAHTQHGQVHVHVVWNRIDLQRGIAAALSYDGRKRLAVARELEQEFGLRQLGYTWNGTLSAKEEAAAIRHGKAPQPIKETLQACWQHAATGKAFVADLDASGMTLAKGDKRGFLVVGMAGDFYQIARVTGSREKEVREKLRDLERDQLPTLDQAREVMKERQSAALRQYDINRRQPVKRGYCPSRPAQWLRVVCVTRKPAPV